MKKILLFLSISLLFELAHGQAKEISANLIIEARGTASADPLSDIRLIEIVDGKEIEFPVYYVSGKLAINSALIDKIQQQKLVLAFDYNKISRYRHHICNIQVPITWFWFEQEYLILRLRVNKIPRYKPCDYFYELESASGTVVYLSSKNEAP